MNRPTFPEAPSDAPPPAAQKVALPAYLPQRLQAYRLGKADRQTYIARDTLLNKTYDFEPWQFFVMEVLPGCEDYGKLAGIFEDRFGQKLSRAALGDLFAQLADAGLLNEQAAAHPLLAPYCKKSYAVEGEQAKLKSFRQMSALPADSADTTATAASPQAESRPSRDEQDGVADDQVLPGGIQDAIDFDPRVTRKMWVLMDPRHLLRRLTPVLVGLRYGLYVLPLLVLLAGVVAFDNARMIEEDVWRLLGEISFFEHLLLSLVTVNLLTTFASAAAATHYRATVRGIGIVLILGFLPRFSARVSHVEQLARRERMWLHAVPLLVRLSILSVAILVWFSERANHEALAQAALALASICMLGLIVAGNPLIKSSGYHLLAAFANEPHLRGKAYKALLTRMRGGTFREADDLLLAAYAAATVLFIFVLIAAVVLMLGMALHRLQLGGSAIIAMLVLGFVLLRRTLRYFSSIEAAYERSVQYERWRKRAVPPQAVEDGALPQKKPGGVSSYLWRAAPLCLFVAMFLPYHYKPGGDFVIYPSQRQVITSDVSGVIREVYFDGGESVSKGTVIARLDDYDYRSQVEVYTARMAEQRAIVEDLKSRPRPEDVALAERALSVQLTHTEFSKARAERIKQLYDQGAASFEDLDAAQRQYQVDLRQNEEKLAALAVVKLGATPNEIAAAEAKWESLKQERDLYQDRVERSALRMPFDGSLLTLHLQQKVNAYLNRGEPFAVAENTERVTAEIEVPESETGYLRIGAPVRLKSLSYSDEVFEGTVTGIDRNVTRERFGNIVKVIAVLENPQGRLKTDMTGYAKIDGPTLPVWKAFLLSVLRFVNVQIWSWIP